MADERRIAIVTGGNRGMGLETCRRLGQIGYTVILTARDPQAGREAAATLQTEGLDVAPFRLDLTGRRTSPPWSCTPGAGSGGWMCW